MSDAGAHLHWKSLSASCTNDSPGAFHQPSACVHCSSCWVQTPTEYSALGVKPLRADATTLLAPSFPEPARLNKLTVPLFLPVSRLKRDGISVPLERCSLPQGVLVFVLLLKPTNSHLLEPSPLGSSGPEKSHPSSPCTYQPPGGGCGQPTSPAVNLMVETSNCRAGGHSHATNYAGGIVQ